MPNHGSAGGGNFSALCAGAVLNEGIIAADGEVRHPGSVMLRDTSGSSSNNFVAYTLYRRAGTRCFGPSTINPTDNVVTYDLFGTAQTYAYCADRSF